MLPSWEVSTKEGVGGGSKAQQLDRLLFVHPADSEERTGRARPRLPGPVGWKGSLAKPPSRPEEFLQPACLPACPGQDPPPLTPPSPCSPPT